MKKLNLYQLSEKATGISHKVGDFLAEAAQVCLEMNGHQSGILIKITGFIEEEVTIEWERTLDKETFLSWKDLKEATEYGATALSLLIILHFTNYDYVERLPQSGLGDYFLKEAILNDEIKSNEAFLEISGIFENKSTNTINIRINQKRKQLENKTTDEKTVLVAVVEFSEPKAKIIKL